MDFYAMTDDAVAEELGHRIAQTRLERDLSQQAMADEIGISRLSYRKLEAGEAKLINVIAALRALGQLDALSTMLPETIFSPMEQLKMKGKVRQRASRKTAERSKRARVASAEGKETPNDNDQGADW